MILVQFIIIVDYRGVHENYHEWNHASYHPAPLVTNVP